MKSLQKSGGLAALYLAVAYLVGLVLFIVVLDYANIADPAQKAALVVEQQDRDEVVGTGVGGRDVDRGAQGGR